jgi:hypothetical protein
MSSDVRQFISSLRRESYYALVQRQTISARRADPNSPSFDPERAVAYHLQRGNVDEAAWLVFLMTHFGRPGSMHVYTENLGELETYISEGHHKTAGMPPMPRGDPFQYVQALLDCERRMRNGEYLDASAVVRDPYWADLVRLLQAFWASGMNDRLDDLLSKFEYSIYRPYAETRRNMRRRFADDPPMPT